MARKVYVKVTASFSPSGEVRPLSFIWTDGYTYEITRVKQIVRAASLKVGGCGIRYTITVDGRDSYMFREDDRWFVEAMDN